MEGTPTHRFTPIGELSPKRRMDNQEWKHKVDLLKERKEKLRRSYWKLKKIATIEEYKSYVEAICECLPLLLTAREERSTVWEFLNLMGDFSWRHPALIQTLQPIADTLNRFAAAYEDWQKVEKYAQEETTADFYLHAMAVITRKIVCYLEGKTFKIDSKLQVPETSGQFIVDKFDKYSSAFGLTQGVHFFEAVVLICPNCRFNFNQYVEIGWNTRRWNEGEWSEAERHPIDEENSLQYTNDPIDDQHSIGFYGSFPTGTVLGCLLDFTQHTFAFYVNGQKVIEKFPKKYPFSCNAYYVLARGDLLYLNFGQVPFKYPPTHLADCPTADLIRQTDRYTLYENVTLMPLFGNQVEPYFTDKKQRKVGETLEQLWKKGEITKENVAEKYAQLWEEEEFHLITYGWRWLQAIIEMENVAEGKVNDWASLVEMMVDFITDEKWYYFNNFLVPYSKLRETAGNRSTRYRTLAILFATILKYKRNYIIYLSISSSLLSFLFSAFLTTTDPITAMFTLIGLEVDKEKRWKELRSTEFTKKVNEWIGIIENTWKMNHSLAQLHLVIHHFEHSLQSLSAPPPSPTPTSLSPSKCSSQAKLSSDCLSLRSDFKWQSARSHLSVDNSLSLAVPVFYFEVTLLTSGPMRIGWATERWQVDGTKLGFNEFSFAYDGSTGCIWHQDVQWRVKNAMKWKGGDVIGCLLDLANKQFTFYQNGEAIELNGDIYSRVSKEIEFLNEEMMVHVYEKNDFLKSTPFISELPYYAALSLGPNQQVTVNFGATFFSFPPKCLDVWDFQQYSEHLKVNKGVYKEFKAVNIGSATNSIISIQGKTITGDFSVNPRDVSTNPKTESSFIIKEPSICGVCKKESNVRLRTLKNCPHLDICIDCASKNLICKECPQ